MDEKECEFCGELIKAAALKCRHCGELLDNAKGSSSVTVRKKIDDAATLSLIMGLCAFFVCPLLAILGIMKGNESKRMAFGAGVPVPGMATAGVIMSWLTIGLNILAILLVVVIFGVAIIAGAR